MVYVALLRGINVGGKNRVEMARLKQLFEGLGFGSVKTFINSGNIIFSADAKDEQKLCQQVEQAIEKEFGFPVPTLLRSMTELDSFMKKLPKVWVNDDKTKCDILFLWDEVDSPDAVNQVKIKPDIEELMYIPGALVWRIGRENINRGSMIKIVGSDFYKKVTIRNPNTVRKIYALMQDLA